MVTGFNHSGLVVKNIKEMVAFYKDVLGLSVIRESKSVAPVEGDHTGFVGAERVVVFLGIIYVDSRLVAYGLSVLWRY